MTVRVLVVDDEKNMRTTLADILGAEGYEVACADCGERAVEACRRQAFDVVLLDLRMTGIDGVETLRRIRVLRRNARVIMMSAYSVEELERAALAEGAVAFLRKPLDPESVIGIVARNGRDAG